MPIKLIVCCTAFTHGISLEQLNKEAYYLPEESEDTVLVAKVVTSIVRGFIGCVGLIGFNRLLELVSAAVVTLVVAVRVLMSECRNNFLNDCHSITT